ncbi:hypothetical protein KTO58_00445 [Chitinophaga pendula]|uniref:hypothetical protein n=1 Tax=Chitinophaga TaxID=79328 RepID=UPI000BAFB452|nr:MULTISPECIES: hypothetical protein [Chitinophaga]ASZ14668.1 hypothetical protein CK934_28810 [Chitinophaga sp. MD30]UCJ07679.1 hypothetical protein KTO58_00445 [Chitinophaga pendula]
MITLKNIMMINAISSGITGIALVVAARPVATLFGLTNTVPFTEVGIFLALFAAFVGFTALNTASHIRAVRTIITLDTLWVIMSAIALVFLKDIISPLGSVAITLVAIWVAAMAVLQKKSLRAQLSHS